MQDVSRAQLIETIRTARAIIDAAWPQTEELIGAEARMGESMIRAQVSVVVLGFLIQGMQEPLEAASPLNRLEMRFGELLEAMSSALASDQQLREHISRQTDLFRGAISAIEALRRIIMESLALAPGPAEPPKEGGS